MAESNQSDFFLSSTDSYFSDLNIDQGFARSALRFIIYTAGRSLEVIIGLIGNILTLIIIKRRKYATNRHILMVYLAISDLLLAFTFPLSTYIFATTTVIEKRKTWGTICIVKEMILYIVTAGNILSYVILSVDT